MRRLLAISILLLVAACDRTEPPATEQAVRPAKLFRVVARQQTTSHEFVGRLDAAQTVDVSFEVDGALAELPVREGQAVARGALVAALDPTDFKLAVREAEVQRQLAQQDLDRKASLLRERSISQAAVDEARANFELAQVRHAQAEERLAKSTITAPFDAYVARRYVDNRTRVRVGERIVRLSDLNELKVLTSLPEELVATVTAERVVAVTARFEFLPERTFPLEYRENTGEASDVAQTFEVAFTMPRPPGVNLLPGMTAQVRIELRRPGGDAGISLPATALMSEPDGDFYVWIYDPQSGRVSHRPVTVAEPTASGVRIVDGLAEGDLVVAAGASQLQEGMQVRPLGEPATQL